MILIGEHVRTPDGCGFVNHIEDNTGYAAVILDKNSHRNNPPIFWATLKELEAWKNDEV